MSSKYQKPYTIPEGFPALLKSFTREILRSQPDNIYDFGARFFADMLEQGGGGYVAERQPGPNATRGGAGSSVLDSMQQTATSINIKALSPAELEALILKLFLEADLDKSGYLDRTEFAAVLKKADLGLTERQMREVLAEADENDDEVIQYQEFLPVMVDILQSIKAKEQAKSMMGQVEALVRGEVEGMLLHGMPPDELQGLMLKVFRRADKDGSGQLSRSEFKDALKAAELGLTRKDINLVLSTVDVNNDGLVSYEEFVPVCFEVLVERFKDEIMTNNIVSNQEGLQGLLLKSLQEADPERTGQLPQRTIKGVLQKLSYEVLGLSTLQVVSIVSQANTAPDGTVSYVTFVPVAAAMIYSMYDVDSMKLRLQAIKTVADAGGIKDLTHMDIDGLRQTLEAAFKEADVAVTGQLSQAQVVDVLNRLGTLTPDTVNLTEAHMNAMFAAIDVDESGTVDWYELATFLCDAIEHMERELYVQSVTQGGGQH